MPNPEVTADLLRLLLEDAPTPEVIATWPENAQEAADHWAAANHLLASDNEVYVPVAPQELVLWAKENGVHLPHITGFTQSDCEAVCLVILQWNKVLGVARRHDHSKFGLPGGKVEPGEDLWEAAIRELKQETGIVVKEEDLHPFFSDYCRGEDKDIFTTAFLVKSYSGEPKTGDAGPVSWVTKEELFAGPFGDYNRALFYTLEHV